MDVFNTMQHELGCCGTLGPRTWLISDQQSIPDSCCRNMYIGCGEANRNVTLSYYLLGCAEVLDTNARWQFASCARASWVTALLELTGMFFTMWSGLTWMRLASEREQQAQRRRASSFPPLPTHQHHVTHSTTTTTILQVTNLLMNLLNLQFLLKHNKSTVQHHSQSHPSLKLLLSLQPEPMSLLSKQNLNYNAAELIIFQA